MNDYRDECQHEWYEGVVLRDIGPVLTCDLCGSHGVRDGDVVQVFRVVVRGAGASGGSDLQAARLGKQLAEMRNHEADRE